MKPTDGAKRPNGRIKPLYCLFGQDTALFAHAQHVELALAWRHHQCQPPHLDRPHAGQVGAGLRGDPGRAEPRVVRRAASGVLLGALN
jgi:hypothetical protein